MAICFRCDFHAFFFQEKKKVSINFLNCNRVETQGCINIWVTGASKRCITPVYQVCLYVYSGALFFSGLISGEVLNYTGVFQVYCMVILFWL